jgi:hypothetical protein
MFEHLKKFFFLLLPIVFFWACSEKPEKSIDSLSKLPIKFAKKIVSSKALQYQIKLPDSWILIDSSHTESESFEGYSDAHDPDGFLSSITVAKYTSSVDDLQQESKRAQKVAELPNVLKRVTSGRSTIIKGAFFEHIRATEKADYPVEIVSFLLHANETNTFYSITVSVPKDEQFEVHMAMLLQCVKEFKIN